MDFLTEEDLTTHSFGVFINGSDAESLNALELCEIQGMHLIASKIGARYNARAIFESRDEDRHPLIIRMLSYIVIYDMISRNAARKVPDDIRKHYDDTLKMLDSIRDRKESPYGLPPRSQTTGVDEEGFEIHYKREISANNSNENYYL